MKEFFEKYKYHIGGSTIGLILLYLFYDMFTTKKDSSTKESTITFNKKVVKENFHEVFNIHENFKRTVTSLTQSMMQFNAITQNIVNIKISD